MIYGARLGEVQVAGKMKKKTFCEVVLVVEKHLHSSDCMKTLEKEFPRVSEGTLRSIYSQLYQQYTKAVHASHRKLECMKTYYSEYVASLHGHSKTVLLDMANKVQFSPALFARIIMEEFISKHCLLPSNTTASSLVSQWMRDITLIADPCLQEQVKTCILNDRNYGPLAENIKHSIGYEYEFLLKEKLETHLITFLDEKALRHRGYDKTPDFKLEVPFLVESHVVNWVESKASFGDQRSHDSYLEDQYWSYQNRFGSGLVIYWFGYVEELDIHAKQGIKLLDHFPAEITTLPSTLDMLINVDQSP